MNQYHIKWQKWADPFQLLLDKYKRAVREQSKESTEDDDFEKSDFSDLFRYNGPVVQTPHGIIPINESNLPSTVFNFWRADINFNLTRQVEYIINTTLGVETYDRITPLRFRIAVGKLFDENDVMNRVTKNIIEHKLEQDSKTPIKKPKSIKNLLTIQYPFHAIVDNNGDKTLLYGNSKEEVLAQIEELKKTSPTITFSYSWGQ